MREGSPIIPDSAAEGEEARRRKEEAEEDRQPKAKPERFGILAIESKKPEEPSPLEAALARSRRTLESEDDAQAKPPPEEAHSEPPAVEAPPLELPAPPPVELLEAADDEPPAARETEPPAEEPIESEPVEAVVESAPAPPVEAAAPIETEPPQRSEAAAEESPEPPAESEPAQAVVEEAAPPAPEALSAPEPEDELRIDHAPTERPPADEAIETPPVEAVEEIEPPARADVTERPAAEAAPEPEAEKPRIEEPRIEATEERRGPPSLEQAPDEEENEEEPARIEPPVRTETVTEQPALEATAEAEEEHPEPARPRRETADAATAPEGGDESPGYIGRTIFTTEAGPTTSVPVAETARASRTAEVNMNVEAASKGPLTDRRLETLTHDELLKLAAEIHIDGDSVRYLYEAHLIGERGLRRLVMEHQKGGDLHKVLGEVLTDREKDFERDPAMRDAADPNAAPSSLPVSGTGSMSLDDILPPAAAPSPVGTAALTAAAGTDEQAAFQEARTKYEAATQQRARSRLLIDTVFFGLIGLLALVVAIIYITR